MARSAVLFDLGGTLLVMRRDRIFREVLLEVGYDAPLWSIHNAYLDAEPWWLSVYGTRKMSPSQTDDAYRDLDTRVFSTLFPAVEEATGKRIGRSVRDRWPEIQKTIPLELYADARPALERLSSIGYDMGLVSNAPAGTETTVEALGLKEYMDCIIISGSVGYSKPNPEIFRIALRQLDVLPERTVHVGDVYESDVVGARAAGITGILLDRDGTGRVDDCPRIDSLLNLGEIASTLIPPPSH